MALLHLDRWLGVKTSFGGCGGKNNQGNGSQTTFLGGAPCKFISQHIRPSQSALCHSPWQPSESDRGQRLSGLVPRDVVPQVAYDKR